MKSLIPNRRGRTAVALIAVAGLALTGCGGKQENTAAGTTGADGKVSCESTAGQISIATGNSTGVYYVLGGGLANLISNNSEIKATAAETGASVQNIQQLVGGQYDIAFSLADSAADAIEGKGSFDKPEEITALARIYSNYTQVVVRKDSGIKTIADMKGKKISTGSPKSGTELIATRLLEVSGLDIDSDLSAQRLELGKTVESMKDGSIDGFVWSGGLPTPALTDLFTSQGDNVEFIDITSVLPKMQELNSVYAEGTISKDVYKTSADIKTIVVPNLLLVRKDFAANNACAITKLLFEKKADLEKVHPSAGELDPKIGLETDPVPLNPGSKQALDELVGS